MNKKYTIEFHENHCLLLTKPTSTILVYRFPYDMIKSNDFEIANRFIVYILLGKNKEGKDTVYVGKSKNGLDNRPTSHENKKVDWEQCFVLTDIRERTVLNDGTIQYLEDKISSRVVSGGKYVNVTNQTNSGTANSSDMENCDIYLDEAYDMLFTLGLDLYSDEDIVEVTDNKKPKDNIFPDKFKCLYDDIFAIVQNVCPSSTIEITKVYHKYMLGKTILASIAWTQSALKLYFNIPFEKVIDGNHILEDVTEKGHWGVGDCCLVVIDKTDFDDIRDFFEQVARYQGKDNNKQLCLLK